MKTYTLEITVDVDDDEVTDRDSEMHKRKQIRQAIEGIDPSVGVFTIENFSEEY